jgi:hypothetical protein
MEPTDFVPGAEDDQELVLAQDAYYDYLDSLQERGADGPRALTFEEFRLQPRAIAPSYEVDPSDDIPF